MVESFHDLHLAKQLRKRDETECKRAAARSFTNLLQRSGIELRFVDDFDRHFSARGNMLGELHLGEIAFADGLSGARDNGRVGDADNQTDYLDEPILADVRLVGITHFTRL